MKPTTWLLSWTETTGAVSFWLSRKFIHFLTIRLFVLLILAYQRLIAPLICSCCRWHPCCSTYAKEAIIKYGAIRGMWLVIKRLARCHPWGGDGYDPVP